MLLLFVSKYEKYHAFIKTAVKIVALKIFRSGVHGS